MAVVKLCGVEFRAACGIAKIIGTFTTALGFFYFTTHAGLPTPFTGPFGHLLGALIIIVAIEETSTILAWIAYKPVEAPKDDLGLPFVTVVIPAYNESSFVQYAMNSILQSDYPRGKLQVVAIDDGSSDDTWKHINTAVVALESSGISCLAHKHPDNLGKRAAICTGFRLAEGDIIVSLDSDSIIGRRSLRNIVSPMMYDVRVGGVAGHLAALNVRHKILPRLLDILFDASGNIPRAAQSHTGGFVTILPGAFSAFRASAVLPLLAGLCESTFLGVPLRHGEDVELTMGLLQRGWTTKYQSNAVVYTTAPETPTRTLLMYTRWERSSYVYLCMGFLGLAINGVLRRAQSIFEQYMSLTHNKGVFKESLGGSNLKRASTIRSFGSLYLLLNLVTTAISNPLLVLYSFIQIHHAIYQPKMALVAIAATAMYSSWQSLLFVADAFREEEENKNFQQSCIYLQGNGEMERRQRPLQVRGEVFIENRKLRLFWRLKYSGLAGVFQMIFVSWSSILALPTLKSQSWLTR